MKTFWENLKTRQKILIFLIPIVTIVIILIVIFSSQTNSNIKIVFNDKNDIPSSEIIKMREKFEKVIRANTENFDEKTTYTGQEREYNVTTDDGASVAIFIVDFDSIKESYKVMITWPDPDDGSPNIIISCALTEGRYPETPCQTESNSSSEIIGYLPHIGDDFMMNAQYSGNQLYLEIISSGDINNAVENAKKWLIQNGFDPQNYLLYAVSNQYVQVNYVDTNDKNINEKLPYFMPNVFYVYPIINSDKNVEKIKAEIYGCTSYQTDPAEENINQYLKNNNINYPVEFEYCAE